MIGGGNLVFELRRWTKTERKCPKHSEQTLVHSVVVPRLGEGGVQGRGTPEFGSKTYYYRPQRSCEGMFLHVCVCPQGEYLARYPPGPGTLPWDQIHTPEPGTLPWDQVPSKTRHTPGTRYAPGQVHPPGTRYIPRNRYPPGDSYCCRWYASYWNECIPV